jgi:Na+-driven multidrug efflux pump
MGCARGIYLSIMEYSVYSFLFSFVSAVTNCIANAILIPRIGIIGATIATIISQIFQAFLGTYMIRKLKPIHKIQLKSLFGFLFIKEDLKNMVSLLRTLIDGKIHKKN